MREDNKNLMFPADGIGRQITVHWGAAAVSGILLLFGGLVGGKAWEGRSQPSPPLDQSKESAEIASRDAKIQSLQQHINDLEQQSEKNQSDLLKQIASLREVLASKNSGSQNIRTAADGVTNSGSAPIPQKSIAKQEEAGIRFNLIGCQAYGSSVTCEFLAESVNGDQWIRLEHSRMVSTDGGEHPAVGGSLGANGSTFSATLAEGAPFQGILRFSGLKQGSGIKLLEIGFSFLSAESHSVKFRDIPVN
jgi:hypothetical protein